MSEEQEIGTEFVKLAAVEVVRQLTESRQLLLEQHSYSFKWLTGSLLAINGGAAVAILSNESIESAAKVVGGAFFSFGVLLALLIGVLSQRANQRALAPLNVALGYWLTVTQNGERAPEIEIEHEAQMKPVLRLGVVGQIFGWASALMFAAGVVSIGLELTEKPAAAQVGDSRADQIGAQGASITIARSAPHPARRHQFRALIMR